MFLRIGFFFFFFSPCLDKKIGRGEKRDKKALLKVKSKELKKRRNLDETSIGIGVSPEKELKNGALKGAILIIHQKEVDFLHSSISRVNAFH